MAPLSTGSVISIHALRKEGDRKRLCLVLILLDFYPRPPQGGRLPTGHSLLVLLIISIHALRKEGDLPTGHSLLVLLIISIHALRKEGDLVVLHEGGQQFYISIHALRKEGDVTATRSRPALHTFLSTPSARRATAKTEKNISAFVSL